MEDKLFYDEMYHQPNYGVNFSLKFTVALDIIRHAALISAKEDGEDTSGRQKLLLLPAKDVAVRALDIAEALVDGGISRGWIAELKVSAEERAKYAGEYKRQQLNAEITYNKE
jgi:hypothetical protein